ncbi:hypothetical protein ALC57_02267 [Trachymyrmex cornetzi]|uniref:Uncharacterized protein n=1 Tax=Trachymyrmex cornetzi TaxID=471704 RepID=A0A195EJW8_9HYME|nr:hypothetical protein ALC57_02267 [Trachymyrmex cornetzi]
MVGTHAVCTPERRLAGNGFPWLLAKFDKLAVTGTVVPSAKKVPRKDQLMHSHGKKDAPCQQRTCSAGQSRVTYTWKTLNPPVLSRVSQGLVKDPGLSGWRGLQIHEQSRTKKIIFKGKVEEIWIFTNDFEKSSDAGHRVSINLAHVPTTVSLARFSYVKRPRTMATMCHSDPMILRNNDDVTRGFTYGCPLRVFRFPCEPHPFFPIPDHPQPSSFPSSLRKLARNIRFFTASTQPVGNVSHITHLCRVTRVCRMYWTGIGALVTRNSERVKGRTRPWRKKPGKEGAGVHQSER